MQRSLKSETEEPSVVLVDTSNSTNNGEETVATEGRTDATDTTANINSVQWEDGKRINDVEEKSANAVVDGNGENNSESGNKRLTVMRQQFAVGGTGTGSSSIEDRFCCTNMALMVYKKAWESARKALPRATRNQNNSALEDNGSSITTPTTFVDQQRRITPLAGLSDITDRPISLESEDEPMTECSFEYNEDDGDLLSEAGGGELSSTAKRGRRRLGRDGDSDRPTTLRGLERLSTDTDEFDEEESIGGVEDVDLEAFKRVYMSDLVIPEEPDKESAATQQETQLKSVLENVINAFRGATTDGEPLSERAKRIRRFRLERFNDDNNNEEDDLFEGNDLDNETDENEQDLKTTTGLKLIGEQTDNSTMSMSDIERFVQVTCDQVMSKVRQENVRDDCDGTDGTDEDSSIRGSGIFKIRPGIRPEHSIDSRASTDATLSTIEIPTITITEDQLDDSSVVLSEATLRDDSGSEGECATIPEDGTSSQGGIKGKATALKTKVKKLGTKVKDIFKRGTTPEVSPAPSPVGEYIDIEEEKRRRREEEKEVERRKKEEEIARKEEEKKRKEEAEKKKRDEELERRALEMQKKAEAEAAKERERQKKEEARRVKEEEKKRKEEEERLRKEEEKARKEEEKARKEEEKRLKAEEERRRKEEERRKKEEEKIRKAREEEEKRRLKQEEEERRRIREEEERRKRLEQEEERRKKQMEEEEEERRIRQRRQEEEEEEKRKSRETLKRKLEDEAIREEGYEEDGTRKEDEEVDNEMKTGTANEPEHPSYTIEGLKDDLRRASSPSLASGHASVIMSKSTSQVAIVVTSSAVNQPREEEVFDQDGESEGEVEPNMDGRKRKKMRKRLRDTKNKLINLKSKALESLPSMSTLKSRVKDILPVRSSGGGGTGQESEVSGRMDPSYSVHREQKIFSEYRKRYPDSENEFFSDSELVESRKSTLKAISPDLEEMPNGMYDDIDTTEDRVQMLLSPINSPLRPPRRSDYCVGEGGMGFHTSEPNISRTGTPKKPKRAPPPRPPPPEVDVYLIGSTTLNNQSITGSTATSLGALEEIDLTSSNRDLTGSLMMIRKDPDKIPASIYYRKVVRDWKERHLKKREHDLVSASSPNLEIYQRPPRPGRHPPRICPLPSNSDKVERPRPLPRRRTSKASLLRQKIVEQQQRQLRENELTMDKENNVDGYETVKSQDKDKQPQSTSLATLPPLPPPRLRPDRHSPSPRSPYSTYHRRQLQLSQQRRQIQHDYLLTADRAHLATDGLYWKPFSWKTGRCRSLTELYVRKRSQPPPVMIDSKICEVDSDNSLNHEPIERSLSYRLMSQYCSPPRPPPPTIKMETPTPEDPLKLVDKETGEPLYSIVDRSKKLKKDSSAVYVNGDIQNRPLPAPPLPPRSKRKNSGSRSRSNSPYLSLTGSSVDLNRPDATFIRPVSPYLPIGMVDVSVETGSQLIYPTSESKECQTSLEDITKDHTAITSNDKSIRSSNAKQESQPLTYISEDYVDDGRESTTPTPITIASAIAVAEVTPQIAIKVTPEREIIIDRENVQSDQVSTTLNQVKRSRLSSSSSKESTPPLVTANSGGNINCARSKVGPSGNTELGRMDDEGSSRTVTSYYDAEECDTDMDTFADLDSLSTETTATLTASTQFHSVLSELPTISSTTTSHYDTDEGDSKTMEIPCPPTVPVPPIPDESSANAKVTSDDACDKDSHRQQPTIQSSARPLVAEHVTIEEDSDDDLLQPRVTSPNRMRAYISQRQMRPDSMDGSDPEW